VRVAPEISNCHGEIASLNATGVQSESDHKRAKVSSRYRLQRPPLQAIPCSVRGFKFHPSLQGLYSNEQ
jgi:hypothetical protein